MNRKNTILIAVMINASLLVLLFITALTTQEELSAPSSTQMAQTSSVQPIEMQPPLFGDSVDQTLRQPTPPPAPLADAQLLVKPAEPEPKPTPAPVLHVLPPAEAPSNTIAVVSPAPIAPAPVASGLIEVIVKKGDTLEKIARAHRTTIDEIIKINHLPSSFLRVGQQLKVPAEKKVSTAPKPKAAPGSENPEYYTVKVGDNPWTIAMKHHMKVDELLRLNALNEEKARKLKPGDRLRTR